MCCDEVEVMMKFKASALGFLKMTDLASRDLQLHSARGNLFACLQHLQHV